MRTISPSLELFSFIIWVNNKKSY